jgi:hypothetical protein
VLAPGEEGRVCPAVLGNLGAGQRATAERQFSVETGTYRFKTTIHWDEAPFVVATPAFDVTP